MRIGIEVNGVLRDTIGKFTQLYEKHMIDENDTEESVVQIDITDENNLETITDEKFKYEVLSPVTTLNLQNHFSFRNEEELYSFMYEDFAMGIFGHAGSSEMTTFNDLNEFYLNNRDNNEIVIISDEIGKSKPATLFFLSKFGCLVEKYIFYSKITEDSIWDNFDVLVTSNPNLLNKNKKTCIKYNTQYNNKIACDNSISNLKELQVIIDKIKNNDVKSIQ
jgi:hypothetical protein